MNAIDFMVRTVTATRAPLVPVDSSSRTGALVALIAQRPVTTADLAAHTGLASKLVWGLLKDRRNRGELLFSGGLWIKVADYTPHEVTKAAELLLAAGWTVRPPSH